MYPRCFFKTWNVGKCPEMLKRCRCRRWGCPQRQFMSVGCEAWGGWWDGRDARGADGDTALVILCLCWVGVGTATYQASALDSNVIKNVVERVGDGCRAWGQCHRVCSERVCLSRVSEKRRKEGVGLGVCLIKCTCYLYVGGVCRVWAFMQGACSY